MKRRKKRKEDTNTHSGTDSQQLIWLDPCYRIQPDKYLTNTLITGLKVLPGSLDFWTGPDKLFLHLLAA